MRGQQQTPINKFPENLPTLNRPTSQESSPILNPLFKIISNIGSRPPGYKLPVQDPLYFRVKFLLPGFPFLDLRSQRVGIPSLRDGINQSC